MSRTPPVRAVFFDVDFTLIYPGPTFQGEGYTLFCARYGMQVDPAQFTAAVRAASAVLDRAQEQVYDDALFIEYTSTIIRAMGGAGDRVEACAREIYAEWAACHHFFMYDDVMPVLSELAARGIKVGLISNSHRSLANFAEHFELDGRIHGAISSSEHGYLKPHPSIFHAALRLLEVQPSESLMVGDSLAHDIAGARSVGMGGVLVQRSPHEPFAAGGDVNVPVIGDLRELLPLL